MKNRWILDGVIFTFIVVAVIASVGITMPPNQDATNQSLYNEISQLQSQINSLQAQSSSQKTQQLTYPLDINSEQVLSDSLNNILPSKMMDLIWRKMIWYTTFFQENVGGTNSGYAVTLTGSGSISNDHNNLALATGATNPSSVEVTKNPEWQG
ncbi:MAG: hypothetical protein KGI08_10240, partial [Thaumarchaeota archaeon]|nr:hypothetical protein [Nitrososphaerota archaeon]